jgi:hypothetical protein
VINVEGRKKMAKSNRNFTVDELTTMLELLKMKPDVINYQDLIEIGLYENKDQEQAARDNGKGPSYYWQGEKKIKYDNKNVRLYLKKMIKILLLQEFNASKKLQKEEKPLQQQIPIPQQEQQKPVEQPKFISLNAPITYLEIGIREQAKDLLLSLDKEWKTIKSEHKLRDTVEIIIDYAYSHKDDIKVL